MKITTETDGACRRTMHVEVPAETVQSEFDSVTQSFLREARMPGFRPGHAPRAMVERRFAKQIAEQVCDRLMPKYYQKAIEQEKITPLTVLSVEPGTTASGQDMSFKVTLDVVPEFELPDYKAIELSDETASVSETEIDVALRDILRSHADYPEVDRPVAENDLVTFDYDAVDDDGALSESAGDCRELCSGRDVGMLMVSQGELFPGFYEQLLGAGKDEERRVETVFPEDYRQKAVGGKTVVYRVSLKTVREEKIPALSDEMLKDFGVGNETELREFVCKRLERMALENEGRRRNEAVGRYLMDRTTIDELPQSLTEEESRSAVNSLLQDLSRQGVAREKIEQARDDIISWAERAAQDRVKRNLVLDKIASLENIDVSQEDFKSYIETLAAGSRMTATDILNRLKKNNAVQHVIDQLRRSKTTRYLLGNALIAPGKDAAGEVAPEKDKAQS